MKQTLLQQEYSVFALEVEKEETSFRSVKEIIDYFKTKVDRHKTAQFIATYDHMSHTRGLPEGQISEEILDAGHIIFCFGITLPNPEVMAVRPRSIGIIELPSSFYITFIEAPMPVANVVMEEWAREIKNR